MDRDDDDELASERELDAWRTTWLHFHRLGYDVRDAVPESVRATGAWQRLWRSVA